MVGAETFAAVDARNNRKLYLDLQKMALGTERHRYVFFMSPLYPDAGRQAKLERMASKCMVIAVVASGLTGSRA